ncbi:MAG: hypothetical protein AB7V56_14590 [Candidatus Nitrosocosmicus sp.]|uniref:hypothetical protein n=1 Tax=Candidatus Nitrosocosmicus agrestis TaxID=2563600 RepID=UPI00122E500B|nr:hypothetical protein [Candidatus Nitrosocosmicus sp. SS]KAA2278877.1 hypothetical protein F1Z66_14855 [Candidatus Nitrosocosmicus sp. SS]KAF0867554.1 hypothetical protein E5N71_14775 [Candidatus Nitrosocosmicus sp. SS]MDR4490319.1 hypothetical protein [Candidatus Nitrosocosmicus sp.]HET7643806.1 hypothetical protein [Nitrososphaeraceae archaeon]
MKKIYSLNFQKLGLSFRFANVFADISEDRINDFAKAFCPSSFSKNMLKLLKIKTPYRMEFA